MAHENIYGAVEQSIEGLCKEFRSRPTLFYTEHDVISYFYTLLQQALSMATVRDRDASEHLLVHIAYPTPFRCATGEEGFAVKGDEEHTPQGALYPRGRYDLVVLNPGFIKEHSYELIKAQDYTAYKKQLLPKLDADNPAILYGLAFALRRDPFPLLKAREGKGREVVDAFIAQVNQDADKLVASQAIPGFMDRIKVLTFVKGGADEVRTFLFKTLSERLEILVCFSY
jgi:hypothetical protein